MKIHLTSEQQKLANYMSEVSERCYSAAWIENLEYVLWDALFSKQRKYGHDFIMTSPLKTEQF